MQPTIPPKQPWRMRWQHAGWACLLILACLLWLPELRFLSDQWREQPMLSHGPLVPVIAAALLWMRRSELQRWKSASRGGLLVLGFSALIYIVAVWADIDFLIPLALIGMIAAGIWFLGGRKALLTSAGALGFLVFMVPWPTTLVSGVAFPMQMKSSNYAALFGGLLGLPIDHQGIRLSVEQGSHTHFYQCDVAQGCSGLTSLLVLLALGYLVAYFTPVKPGWRAFMVAIMPPLALITNTLRIVIILLVGTYINKHAADWVHKHEGPVLIFLCSFALLGIRQLILIYTPPQAPRVFEIQEAIIPQIYKHRLGILNLVLVLAVLGSDWGRHIDSLSFAHPSFLTDLRLPFRDWTTQDEEIDSHSLNVLKPDGWVVRDYFASPEDQKKKNYSAQLTVIAGHKKSSIHTPSYCMPAGGWETLLDEPYLLSLPDGTQIPVTHEWTKLGNTEYLMTYFFTDGRYNTSNLIAFDWAQLQGHFQATMPMGALVRILVRVQGNDEECARRLSDEFARTTVPGVLESLRQARLKPN